jgi:hypothetical protein
MKVVVAGRVWTSLDDVPDVVEDVVCVVDFLVPVVVWVLVPVDDWAAALDAAASVNAAAITKRFLNIRTASKTTTARITEIRLYRNATDAYSATASADVPTG